MTLAEPGSPCSLPRNGGHAVESLALAHCGRPTSFTRCWGGPGTPWPRQARGCGRNIENFGDGQRLPKLRAGCSSHPGGTNSFKNLRRGVVFAGGVWLRLGVTLCVVDAPGRVDYNSLASLRGDPVMWMRLAA